MAKKKSPINAIIGALGFIIAAIIGVLGIRTCNKPDIPPEPFPIVGWYTWPDDSITITTGSKNNICIINTNNLLLDSAGIVNADLGNSLTGKTLILYFSNTENSLFYQEQMVKLEYADRKTIEPHNRISIDGYVPVENSSPGNGIAYKIPDNYNGRLNLIFYKSELKNLQIAAFYK
jgi:hypothetical protein